MKTYVCPKCNGLLEWFATAKWNNDSQSFVVTRVDECWCNGCNEFIKPKEVALDKWIANGQS